MAAPLMSNASTAAAGSSKESPPVSGRILSLGIVSSITPSAVVPSAVVPSVVVPSVVVPSVVVPSVVVPSVVVPSVVVPSVVVPSVVVPSVVVPSVVVPSVVVPSVVVPSVVVPSSNVVRQRRTWFMLMSPICWETSAAPSSTSSSLMPFSSEISSTASAELILADCPMPSVPSVVVSSVVVPSVVVPSVVVPSVVVPSTPSSSSSSRNWLMKMICIWLQLLASMFTPPVPPPSSCAKAGTDRAYIRKISPLDTN